jgi:hypothetical protein
MSAVRRILRIPAAAAIVGVLSALAIAPAQSDATLSSPLVVCEDANNEVDVNFTGGTANTATSIFHGCVSVDIPSIVYGEVRPKPGIVSGSPSAATVSIPQWTIDWYNASDTKVAESVLDLRFTYIGPLPQEMVATALATDPDVELGVGTASRACQPASQCTYYNQMARLSVPRR